MSIYLIGLNHRTAPIELREQLAFSREGVATALMLFRNRYPDSEVAILSTCNRVEILVASEGARPTVDDVITFIAEARDLPVRDFRDYLYEFRNEKAVRQLFRVASGLDSMVLGEYQIVSQLKAAYAQASEQGTTGRLLNRLFHHAFGVSKEIRTETQIGERKVSVPSVAVDVASSIFSDFSDKHVLVVGAGEMAQLVCQYLRDARASHFTVTSRTLKNAQALASACEGKAVPYAELDAQLAQADIVITATSCPKPLLTADRVRAAQEARRGRAMFVIDLAVPRNVESQVQDIRNVYLYDVDALGSIVAENQQFRMGQLEKCEGILDQEIEAFAKWQRESLAKPMIQQMFSDAHDLRDVELARLFAACDDLTPEQQAAVTALADRLINKLMHPCVQTLREHTLSPPSATLAGALHEVAVKHCNGNRRVAG